MTYAGHIRAIATLGLPLIGGHLAWFAIGLTDTVMLGWYGVEALAAVTLAASFFFVLFLLGAGFGSAVMPLVASSHAEGDEVAIRRYTRMGLWWSLLYAALSIPLFQYSEQILLLLGQDPDVAARGAQYLRIAGWGIFPAVMVWTLKSYLAALERTQIVLWITILSALANALVNYVLIFGNWGAPELGIAGAAIASVVTQLVSLVAVVIYALKVLPEHSLFQRFWRPDWEIFTRIGRMGIPIGLTSLSEATLFTATSVMMGWVGEIPLAAHGIAMQLASATFMVHLGLSNAATIRVGNALGRKDRAHLTRGAFVITLASLAVSAGGIALYLGMPETLISLFMESDDPARDEILAVGTTLLAMAALFQTMDGAQVIGIGLLRGVRDTAVPMVTAAISYALGLGASYVFGFMFDLGGVGIWLGLVAGLTLSSLFQMLRFWRGPAIDRALPAGYSAA
jgi:MATE family multidrug resistance protein